MVKFHLFVFLQLMTGGAGGESPVGTTKEENGSEPTSCTQDLIEEGANLASAGMSKNDSDPPACVDDLSDGAKNEDVDWDYLTDEDRACLLSVGWIKEAWDCEAELDDLMTWEELSEEKQRNYESRMWTKERWNQKGSIDPCFHVQEKLLSRPELFQPTLLDLNIPALNAMDLDFWSRLAEQNEGRGLMTRLVDGNNGLKDGEPYMAEKDIGSFIKDVKESSDPTFYLNFEEENREKRTLTPVVGEVVMEEMKNALAKNQSLVDRGLWHPLWNTLDDENGLDWGVFLGAKGTKTHMHYDSDVMNVLYVAEGRKRAIVIPNDERTAGRYISSTLVKNWDGGAEWTGINLLDSNRTMEEHAVEFIIEAGQALVLPYLAWHALENLESGVAYSLRIVD